MGNDINEFVNKRTVLRHVLANEITVLQRDLAEGILFSLTYTEFGNIHKLAKYTAKKYSWSTNLWSLSRALSIDTDYRMASTNSRLHVIIYLLSVNSLATHQFPSFK